MARGKASWALGYFGLPRSSAGSRRGSLLGICTACDKNEAYFQLQRNLLYCLAPTLSQATDQVDRVGMVPCTLSIKSALDLKFSFILFILGKDEKKIFFVNKIELNILELINFELIKFCLCKTINKIERKIKKIIE